MTPKQWLDEVDSSRKRDSDWRKDAERLLAIYGGEKKDETPFNILFSNTETLLPALYSASPRPIVKRRFTKKQDRLAATAAMVGTRLASFLLDSHEADYAEFDVGMEDATIDYLLVGRGAMRIRYDAKVEKDADGSAVETISEQVCFESVKWDRWGTGPGRKWSKLPWIYFTHFMTKAEAKERFGATKAAKLTYEVDEEDKEKNEEDRKEGVAKVVEIWDKESRKVLFLAESQDEPLLEVDDPLGWDGFFPMAEPPRAVKLANSLAAIPPYILYENQAEELNIITRRIKRLTSHLKVRGAYDARIVELEEIFSKDDGEMVAASNLAAMQDSKGLDSHLWLVPIEKIIAVLQQLLPIRAQIKQTIYEITGIADVIRGASAASETLGAQELKERWVTLRLKRMQKDIQRFARDSLRIALEVAFKKMRPETIAAIVDIEMPTMAEKMEAQAAMAAVPPDQVPPELAAAMAAPGLEEVIGLLASNTHRRYRIDIETNSTVELEATQDKQEVNELLISLSQFLSGAAPLVESGALPFEAAKSIMLQVVRRFRFGDEVEEELEAMQPPAKPAEEADDSAVKAAELDLKQKGGEMDIKMKTIEAEKKILERQVALDLRELELKVREDTLQKDESMAQERIKLSDEHSQLKYREAEQKLTSGVAKVNRQHEDKVKGMIGGVEKQAAQSAAAGTQLTSLVRVIQELLQGQKEVFDTLREQSEATTKVLENLAKARGAPVMVERDPKTGRAARLVPQEGG